MERVPLDGEITQREGEGLHQQTEDRTQFWASGTNLKNQLAETGLDFIFKTIPYSQY